MKPLSTIPRLLNSSLPSAVGSTSQLRRRDSSSAPFDFSNLGRHDPVLGVGVKAFVTGYNAL